MRNLDGITYPALVDTICRISQTFGETIQATYPRKLDCGDMSPWEFIWEKIAPLYGGETDYDYVVTLHFDPDDARFMVHLDPEISSLPEGHALIGWLVSNEIAFTIGGDRLVVSKLKDSDVIDAEDDEDEEVEVVLQ